ncbi:expressed unknown protein [Ectocarpus siliculosus]|uniref:Uncharacterized protein n=1 Tax=Ectocarpus siliculosus TaxID=2880 RepID=D8LS57_ECTSI|nr:expressed unknown protein [Ectocarpus siliculosus]|eukprot:CBN75114.1 expressed unknown protein [Ectocarpus siliculosus]
MVKMARETVTAANKAGLNRAATSQAISSPDRLPRGGSRTRRSSVENRARTSKQQQQQTRKGKGS